MKCKRHLLVEGKKTIFRIWAEQCELQSFTLGLLCVQDIDGQALLLLTLPTVQECMDLKLGPAIKLCHQIERVKVAFYKQFANWLRSSDGSERANTPPGSGETFDCDRLLSTSTNRGTAGGCFPHTRSWRIHFWDTTCVKILMQYSREKNS